ncbi:thiamine pyrophosphate enzyme-like TPP binding protein [Pseudanabaena sp. lw0831]|uniref:hypothetical protein n=1 Tax=Pseudanabaena sp. lw0831 TaxID=1357935 RepID=UPI001915EE90|nr:hypothetical protein [Pseudanabaena sp. lw0831]GBO55414.1 thiamine pyrophosphate enzyme-like TPP binding protein [Pseudanabaena sp. lw0831]
MNIPDQPSFTLDHQQLAEARIQLHYAIQPLAAISNALADSSNKGLFWDDQLGFTTRAITLIESYRLALDPIALTLNFVTDRDQVISAFALSDRTLTEAFDWMKAIVGGLGGAADLITPISYPPNDFPDSDLARGATFQLLNLTSDLAEYYASADRILQNIVQQEPMASDVRIWPHHFDMATLISIPDEINGQEKSVGIGLSPGDSSYNEPYWYVTPYPYPEDRSNLPILDGDGIWHTEGWVGAILTASQFGEPRASIDQVNTFLKSAIVACKKLLN